MRWFVLMLLFASLVSAVSIDPETGCEKYTDHIICPQPGNATLRVVMDTFMQCPRIQNEFGRLEDLICIGDGILLSDVSFEKCSVYVPFDRNDVILSGINDRYRCRTYTWKAGSEITIMAPRKLFDNCVKKEGDEYYELYNCGAENERFVVKAMVSEENGTRYAIAYEMEKEVALIDRNTLIMIIVGIIIIMIGILWRWKNEHKEL
ncbi:MAG: hypothetical protein J7K68_00230 [Candidatus Diapherotrites archaeon]|nr:hypothetical protein [Candidatus Diapherotrites archaeon]